MIPNLCHTQLRRGAGAERYAYQCAGGKTGFRPGKENVWKNSRPGKENVWKNSRPGKENVWMNNRPGKENIWKNSRLRKGKGMSFEDGEYVPAVRTEKGAYK